MIEFLMHVEQDTVGVAVVDIKAGRRVTGRILHGGEPEGAGARGHSPGAQDRVAGF